ncbi:hypothetical protein ACFO0N_17515 [Halobium salinum]|uniref:Uncharacterized protein n=1 Tax=Halobium salinum TaxID=1364940 RepID=A0ABD5PFR5_9EURY|nr:hypothetical protein [Halobium salinum]
MRVIRAAASQRCFRCGERAEVVVARGYRTTYVCWEHAPEYLEAGGVIVGSDLG